MNKTYKFSTKDQGTVVLNLIMNTLHIISNELYLEQSFTIQPNYSIIIITLTSNLLNCYLNILCLLPFGNL